MSFSIKTSKDTLVEVINCGNFLLDGGSMFGRVPRTMWEKWFPPDERNRILMATNVLRICKNGATYLVDTGLGTSYGKKDRANLGLGENHTNPVEEPADHLICTHLHFDHVGGIQDIEVRNRVVVSAAEWDDAQVDNPLVRGSYRRIDLELINKEPSDHPPALFRRRRHCDPPYTRTYAGPRECAHR